MKLTEVDYDYLAGNRFSDHYNMTLEENILLCRNDRILDIVRGKSVLHVGCCDHKPLITSKIQSHTWLHGLLEENCSYVLGVDIDKEAVDYVNSEGFSKNKVYCADMLSDSFTESIPKKMLDYVLFGEMIEHVDNPVQFLTRARENLKRYGFNGKYIVTAPNALALYRTARDEKERVNSDHRYWFTPYTLSKVLYRSGIKPEEILFASNGLGGNGGGVIEKCFYAGMDKFFHKKFKYHSVYGDTVIVVGKSINE